MTLFNDCEKSTMFDFIFKMSPSGVCESGVDYNYTPPPLNSPKMSYLTDSESSTMLDYFSSPMYIMLFLCLCACFGAFLGKVVPMIDDEFFSALLRWFSSRVSTLTTYDVLFITAVFSSVNQFFLNMFLSTLLLQTIVLFNQFVLFQYPHPSSFRIIVSVFLEEIHKIYFGMTLPVTEYVSRAHTGFAAAVLPFLMHCVCVYSGSFTFSFVLHCIWNFVVFRSREHVSRMNQLIPNIQTGALNPKANPWFPSEEGDFSDALSRYVVPEQTPVPFSRYGIPDFHPTFAVHTLRDRLRGAAPSEVSSIVAELESKGYPQHIVKTIRRNMERGSSFGHMARMTANVRSRRPEKVFERRDVEGKSRSKKAVKQSFKKGSGKTAKIWQIRRCKYVVPMTGKPLAQDYTLSRFRKWVKYMSSVFTPLLTSKTQLISGNLACQTLYYSSVPAVNLKNLQYLLDKAAVYIDDYTYGLESSGDVIKKGTRVRVSDYVPIHGLRCGEILVTNSIAFSEFEPLFRKHKPLYKTCLSYFSSPLDGKFDVSRVQGLLDQLFPVVKQVPIVSTGGDDFPVFGAVPKVVRVYPPQGSYLFKVLSSIPLSPTYVLQGNTPSINHVVTVDMPEVVPAVLTSLGGTAAGYERIIVQVVSLITGVATSTSWQNGVAVIMQFVSGNDYVWKHCSEFMKRLPKEVVLSQGTWDWLDVPIAALASLWQAVVCSSVAILLKETLKEMADTVLLPVMDLIKATRFAFFKNAGDSLAKLLIEGITTIFSRIKSAFELKSMAPLFGSKWNPAEWVAEVEGNMTYYPLLTTTITADPRAQANIDKLRSERRIALYWTGPVTLGHFVDINEEAYQTGKALCKYFSSNNALHRELYEVNRRLRIFLDTVLSGSATMIDRVQPFMIYYFGPAGVGKTNILTQISKSIGNLNSYDVTNTGRYKWMPNVNFQDGLNHTQWSVVMDDIDQGVAPPAAGVPNHIESVIALVNNSPIPVEQASVELKGKIRANPLLVSYSSNFIDGKVMTHSAAPDAFWRRVKMHVEPVPKPEYASAGILDPQKALDSVTHDMFVFKVRYFDPALWEPSNRSCIPLTPPVLMTFAEFAVEANRLFKMHIEMQRKMLEMRATRDFCPMCGLDSSKSCGHEVVMQGKCSDYTSAFSSFTEAWAMKLTGWMYTAGMSATNVAVRAGVALDRIPSLLRQWEKTFFMMQAATLIAVLTGAILLLKRQITHQGRELNSTGVLPPGWARSSQEYRPGVPLPNFATTFTKEDILLALKESHFLADGVKYKGMHCFRLGHNTFVAPTHLCEDGEVITFKIDGVESTMIATPFNRVRAASNPELSFFKFAGLKGGSNVLAKCLGGIDESVMAYDEVELWSAELLYSTKNNAIKSLGSTRVLTTDMPTQAGDCGAVYLVCFNGQWRIGAMHYAAAVSMLGSKSLGALMSQIEMKAVLHRMSTTFQGVVTPMPLLSKSKEVSFSKYPYKSEVWAAMHFHGATPYCFGTMEPPLPGSNMITKLKHSIFHQDFKHLEEEWCGSSDYWNFPEFRGSMQGEKWTSPFTRAFKTQNRAVFDDKIMWIALMDFLSEMDKLDNVGYSQISEHDAIAGIPGSYIGKLNLKTSTGPPYNVSKHNHFTSDGDLSPEMQRLLDSISYAECDNIVAPIGLNCLKDEPVKPNKPPRVFTCLSASYNLHMKQEYSPIKCFMRANFEFFESAVGIDMTSSQCNKIISRLSAVDPSLTHLYDGDAEALDKSWSPAFFDFVALLDYAVAQFLGLDAYKIFHLTHGIKHTRMVIKNDVFTSFWNPSGHDDTVEFNGKLMSLGERYFYYFNKADQFTDEEILAYSATFFENPIISDPRLTFRKEVALIHYGDDNVKATLVPQTDYVKVWRDDLGINMTSARKDTSEFLPLTITEISFLKRTFRFEQSLNMYVPPLSKKSLMRSLLFKKDSTLSMTDHAAQALTEISKESVFHGREFCDSFVKLAREVAIKYNLTQNPYYRVVDYDESISLYAEGKFRTWNAGENVQPLSFHDFDTDC